MRQPAVTCGGCGFEWFGPDATRALRVVGRCTRCRGELEFHDEVLPELVDDVPVDTAPHNVLGKPRIPGH